MESRVAVGDDPKGVAFVKFPEFFRRLTENEPFPYQVELAEGAWPAILDVPTGLGKTAAAVVAWLYKLVRGDADTGRRLVYCLPMRVLVEQTAAAAGLWCERAKPLFEEAGLAAPDVHRLLGGDVDQDWDLSPERPALLVGTQDMLLSRALNRGYAMSRYRWPVHFSLLNNDCLWVFDETQLMGVGVETSAQLDGLRRSFGTSRVARSMWMSATLGRAQLSTVDHPEPSGGWPVCTLGPADRDSSLVRKRTLAKKDISRAPIEPLAPKQVEPYVDAVASRALELHEQRKGLTLVVVNRVPRAQALFDTLRARLGRDARIALVHSRFRPPDRQVHEALLTGSGDRIVVATQAVEAGVDVSATTLLTELAPWPSLVQRFGRCNRYGEQPAGHIEWLDIDTSSDKADSILPYAIDQLDEARALLTPLGDAGPATLAKVEFSPPRVIRPVLRRRDLLELFDTTPDLSGDDIDVSRFVRDDSDSDVQAYWRHFDPSAGPAADLPPASRAELCRISLGAFTTVLGQLEKRAKKAKSKGEDDALWRAWEWNALDGQWLPVRRARPGQLVLLHVDAGGYDAAQGFSTGLIGTGSVPELGAEASETEDALDADGATDVGRWVGLTEHLGHVEKEARALASSLSLPPEQVEDSAIAGRWHDVGKAHPEFQRRLLEPVERGKANGPGAEGLWAKSNHTCRVETTRPHFRHELASALAFLGRGQAPSPERKSLIAYLIAAHHGKVRLSIRSLPGEQAPPGDPERLFARGVWDGDELPELTLPDGSHFEHCTLDLSPMLLGEGSWLDQMLRLRDDAALGPFRLALLETVVRVADWRASDKERRGGYDA